MGARNNGEAQVGNEPVVLVDFQGMVAYAKQSK
jgi:hypothetical protein